MMMYASMHIHSDDDVCICAHTLTRASCMHLYIHSSTSGMHQYAASVHLFTYTHSLTHAHTHTLSRTHTHSLSRTCWSRTESEEVAKAAADRMGATVDVRCVCMCLCLSVPVCVCLCLSVSCLSLSLSSNPLPRVHTRAGSVGDSVALTPI